jgi:hypothetical protein
MLLQPAAWRRLCKESSVEKKSEKKVLGGLAAAGILLGGLALSACENGTSSKKPDTSAILSAKTLGDFQSECAKLGGKFAAHDCAGMNECSGHSYLEGEPVKAHDCKGHSACKGGSCVES